jgi:hypothetical protein
MAEMAGRIDAKRAGKQEIMPQNQKPMQVVPMLNNE